MILRVIFKIFVAVFASILILLGIILTPTPLPVGLVLIGIGLALLVNVSPEAIRWLRGRWRWFDLRLHDLENILPKFLAEPIRRSDCDHDNDEGSDDEDEDEETNADFTFINRIKHSRHTEH